jgi:hypothetical protein
MTTTGRMHSAVRTRSWVVPVMCGERCRAVLLGYLHAVVAELGHRGLTAVEGDVRSDDPQQSLSGVLDLGSAGVARWHEEMGWSVEPHGGGGRRYLPDELAPHPVRVAEFVAAAVRGDEVGIGYPIVHRYRLLGDQDELLRRIAGLGNADTNGNPGDRLPPTAFAHRN